MSALRLLWAVVAPWSWATLWFGGGSSSSSSTSTSYSTTDNRIAAAEGANVVRAGGDLLTGPSVKVEGSGNTIETVSDNVVAAAFDYARTRDALAGETLDNVLGATRDIYARASSALEAASAVPRGQLTERTLVVVIVGALGLGGLLLLRRKG